MKTKRFAALLLTALLLTACGGPGSPTPPGGGDDTELPPEGPPDTGPGPAPTFRMSGLVMLTEVTAQDSVSFVAGSGSFFEAAVPEGQPGGGNPFEDVINRCFVGEERPRLQTPFTAPAGDVIDAGEPLEVEHNGEGYTRLIRNDNLSYYIAWPDVPEAPLPDSGLSLTVPGAEGEYPAMTGVAFPESRAFTLTAPEAGEAITLDTTFTWNAHTPEAVVVLAGTGGPSAQAFLCVTPDTGTFALPAETRAALEATGFSSGQLTAAGRFYYRHHLEGDAELTLMSVRFLDLEPVDDPFDDFEDDWEDWTDFDG